MALSKLRALVQNELRSGLSDEKVALAIALGMVIGVFPVLGTTTALCAIAASALRLNQVLIQAVNYAVYPACIALMIPFVRFGGWLFGADVRALTLSGLRALFAQGFLAFATQLSRELLHAAAAWLLVAPIAVVVLRAVALVLIRRRAKLARAG